MTISKRKIGDSTSDGVPKCKKQRSVTDFFKVAKVKADTSSHVTSLTNSKSCEVYTKYSIDGSKLIEDFKAKLSPELQSLLALEMNTIDATWFNKLNKEFTMHYFLQLKRFLIKEQEQYSVFPPPNDIYSWSRMTHFDKVRVIIIGQDPYHNFNQAHGLAFSVKAPTPAPPSLKNIYKELQKNYADFVVDSRIGDLSAWANQGVLLLNTCLTVRAHNANSHSKKGWEPFTTRVIQVLAEDRRHSKEPLVFFLWGSCAIKVVEKLVNSKIPDNFLILKSAHPSPLSASKGFFGNYHFKKINEWLYSRHHHMIDWSVVPGATLKEVTKANVELSTYST